MDTERSDSYLVVERMIREGTVTSFELADLLTTLENQGLITAPEHGALLELAVDAKLGDRTFRQAEGPPEISINTLLPEDRAHAVRRLGGENSV